MLAGESETVEQTRERADTTQIKAKEHVHVDEDTGVAEYGKQPPTPNSKGSKEKKKGGCC